MSEQPANSHGEEISLRDWPWLCLCAFRAGWSDAHAGRSSNVEYDQKPPDEQQSYEQGRLCAINVRIARLNVPPWNGGRTGAQAIDDIIDVSFAMVGASVPGRHGDAP